MLQKILELNPGDVSSQQKLSQVLEMKKNSQPKLQVVTEEQGHEELISIIETQVKAKSPKELKLEATFNHFLYALKERAQTYR